MKNLNLFKYSGLICSLLTLVLGFAFGSLWQKPKNDSEIQEMYLLIKAQHNMIINRDRAIERSMSILTEAIKKIREQEERIKEVSST